MSRSDDQNVLLIADAEDNNSLNSNRFLQTQGFQMINPKNPVYGNSNCLWIYQGRTRFTNFVIKQRALTNIRTVVYVCPTRTYVPDDSLLDPGSCTDTLMVHVCGFAMRISDLIVRRDPVQNIILIPPQVHEHRAIIIEEQARVLEEAQRRHGISYAHHTTEESWSEMLLRRLWNEIVR